MLTPCSTEQNLTLDSAIARFINEDPADYTCRADTFDVVDDVESSHYIGPVEKVGPVSYERDILAGIVLAREIRNLRERIDRQAAWGKEKQLQIRKLEFEKSTLEWEVSELKARLHCTTEEWAIANKKHAESEEARIEAEARAVQYFRQRDAYQQREHEVANELVKITATLRRSVE